LLKERTTYEIMRPEDVGLAKTEFVLGKHSGRHALRQRVQELGYHLDEAQFQHVFEAFKALADRKKDVYDADIEALAESQIHSGPALWTLDSFHTSDGTGTLPMAAVCLEHIDGRKLQDAACGDGPVDAVFKTIERITGVTVQLRDYQVRSVSIGEDAQGEARVEVEHNGRVQRGQAVSTDIIEASANAFLQAINRLAMRRQTRLNPQTEMVTSV
jgi:2-isopropylmalate synthase